MGKIISLIDKLKFQKVISRVLGVLGLLSQIWYYVFSVRCRASVVPLLYLCCSPHVPLLYIFCPPVVPLVCSHSASLGPLVSLLLFLSSSTLPLTFT